MRVAVQGEKMADSKGKTPVGTADTVPAEKGAESGPRPSLPMRWGVWVAEHRWHVLLGWLVLFIVAAAAYPHLMASLSAPDYSVTGSDSAQVTNLIQSDFSAAGAEQDVIVLNSGTLKVSDIEYQGIIDQVVAAVKNQPGVVSVISPLDAGAHEQISDDAHAAYITLGLNGDDRERATESASLEKLVQQAVQFSGVDAYLTGYSQSSIDLTEVENADVERAESIGIPIALIVLVIAVGAVAGGLTPLVVALASLTLTFGALSLLIIVKPMDSFLLSLVTMIGVGISIDYSLFIVSRFQEELVHARDAASTDPVATAVGVAMSTSGRTILFSGSIVMISLFSLFIVKSPLFEEMAIGAVAVVLCTLFTAWTLLPALLAALAEHVNWLALPKAWRPSASLEGGSDDTSGWAKWARTVIRHPWIAIPGAAMLILFALPMLQMKLGIDLGLNSIADTPTGKAETILTQKFSPGLLSPIQILAIHDGSGPFTDDDLKAVNSLTQALKKDSRVDQVYSVTSLTTSDLTSDSLQRMAKSPSAAADLAMIVNVNDGVNKTIITVVTKAPIDSTDAQALVQDLRTEILPTYAKTDELQMLVGGETAQFEDLGVETLAKLPWVMAIVLALSFCYLLIIFRSLLIPTKAVLMNLLATGAAFGLTSWVFVGGHLEKLFGFTSVGFVQTYLPIMTFALLFGLSMDYEVFLMGRMREEWLRTHDNDESVVAGVSHTARAITSAAAIMAAVFGCFLVASVLELKEFGFALAVAVVLDATIVRLLLVPAIMKYFGGEANWWLPDWLDRILPNIRVD